MAIDNQCDGEVLDGAKNFQKRQIAMSDQSNPTDKLRAHLVPVFRVTHREGYRTVLPRSFESNNRQSTDTRRERSTDKSTEKLKAYREAVYCDMYREDNRQVYLEVYR